MIIKYKNNITRYWEKSFEYDIELYRNNTPPIDLLNILRS